MFLAHQAPARPLLAKRFFRKGEKIPQQITEIKTPCSFEQGVDFMQFSF
jgi:hypothetical protein